MNEKLGLVGYYSEES